MPIYFKKEKVKQQIKNYWSMDSFPEIKGYDFEKQFDFEEFIGSYSNMGFQGSNFGLAVNILNEMAIERKKGLGLWLSFTGNMVSSGNREIIKFLVKNKAVDGITTTAAAVEEDILKCIKPFHLGSFEVKGKLMYDECVGRIGNIFVPYDRYAYFEKFLNDFLSNVIQGGNKATPSAITEMLGGYAKEHELTKANYMDSFLFWAAKNKIPVFCPGITDGALGDMTVFFRQRHPELVIDVAEDHTKITNMLQQHEKAGCIILGGGIAKHYLLNAAIFREGFEYSIYITTASEYDGSDSGGNQEEAITWAKIKPDAKRVKVIADATLIFPLLAACWKNRINQGYNRNY